MKDFIILFLPVQTPYQGKFWYRTDRSKCCHPIRLQDSLITNISGKNRFMSLHGDSYYRKVLIQTIASGWVWSGLASHTETCS